jgi:hypothetical protein
MTPHRMLQINAAFTATSAVVMLALRGSMYTLFGLETPTLLDITAVGLLGYAAALVFATRAQAVDRRALLAFAIADAAWVVGSAIVLLLFWSQLAPVGRVLIIVAALAVEVFATAQFRAAGGLRRRTPQAV